MAAQIEKIFGDTSRFFNVFFDRLNSSKILLLKITISRCFFAFLVTLTSSWFINTKKGT